MLGQITTGARRNKRNLKVAFVLTAGYMVAEATAGVLTGSLSLFADAGHMLTDAGALGLALFAIRFAERPATRQNTYGYLRVEIVASLANSVALLLITIYILYEAWQRFQSPPEVLSLPMLLVAVVGLGVKLIGVRLLHRAAGESLNIRGAYLEVLSDTLGSLGVIAASLIMLKTGWYLADPVIGAAIGLFIVPRTWLLLKEAVHILMEGTPPNIDLRLLEQAIRQVAGVKAVHDLHVWSLTSGLDSMSAHVTVENLTQGDRILSELQRLLKEQFQIGHSTIQLEQEGCEPQKLAF